MEQNLQVPEKLAQELIGIERQLEPLEARKEEIKAALRGFGATTYDFPGAGSVQVGTASVSRIVGQKPSVVLPTWEGLSDERRAQLLKDDIIQMDDVWSRTAKAAVSTTLV